MIIVAQLGARMHYAVPAILQRSGMLERLYTDIYAPRLPKQLQALASRYGPPSFRRWFGRVPADIPEEKIVSFNAMGLEYYRRRKSVGPDGFATAAHIWAGKELCRRVIRTGLGYASAVFTYNSAGLELLRHARNSGKLAVMEQTIAAGLFEDKLLKEEQSIHNGWATLFSTDPLRSAIIEREQMEWEASDLILCGSEFVRESILASGGPIARCRLLPYGIRPPATTPAKVLRHRPLRVLTVGAVGLRKGAPYVLVAARILKREAEFRMAGQLDISVDAQKMLSEHVTLLGAVPRSEIHRQFEWADVFLLPTLCEGSATVCYEALAHGLPVITTPNAGSVVRDGIDGFIVPIRDVAAIVDRIERLIEDEDLWAAMARNAQERAADYTVEKYGERLLTVLQAIPAMAD